MKGTTNADKQMHYKKRYNMRKGMDIKIRQKQHNTITNNATKNRDNKRRRNRGSLIRQTLHTRDNEKKNESKMKQMSNTACFTHLIIDVC